MDRVKSAEAFSIAIILGEAAGLRASSFNIFLYITIHYHHILQPLLLYLFAKNP